MSDQIKPIKRHESLVPFSHDHHHGLVFCTRLKQGHKTDDETLRNFVMNFWEEHLEAHFNEEENLLLPVMPKGKFRQQFLEEHASIRQLVNSINEPGAEIKMQTAALAQILNEHIRFEERIMFPWLEEALTKDQLIEIRNGLNGTQVCAHVFQPEFWKRSNP